LKKIISHIRFPHLRLHFLLDIVPEISKRNPNLSDQINKLFDLAIEYKAGGKNRMEKKVPWAKDNSLQLIARSSFKDGNLATLKHTFTDISKWDQDPKSRLYSPKFYVNGYEWYFYLQKKMVLNQPIVGDPMEIDNTEISYQLAVFLRCNSKYMPPRHFLPICMTVSVALRPSSERKFKSNYVIFEQSDKAIGGPLSDERWETIRNDPRSLLINDSITVTIYIEFLENPDSCQVFT